MNALLKVVALLALLALASTTAAQGPAEEIDLESADGLQVILAQQRELREDIERDGLEGLTKRETNQVKRAQDQVFGLTEGASRLDELNIDQKVQLENLLEQINALVKNDRRAEDDQSICWRERKSGSAMKVTRCGTRAEMREAREGARDFLERPKVCGEACGGD